MYIRALFIEMIRSIPMIFILNKKFFVFKFEFSSEASRFIQIEHKLRLHRIKIWTKI